jgi:hypothetical protein
MCQFSRSCEIYAARGKTSEEILTLFCFNPLRWRAECCENDQKYVGNAGHDITFWNVILVVLAVDL